MSWESYQQRASGTNVQRILSEMAEAQRLKEERRAREEAQQRQNEYAAQQAREEALARVQATYMAHPSEENWKLAQSLGAFTGQQFEEAPDAALRRRAAREGLTQWDADPMHGLGTGGAPSLFYNIASGGDNPPEVVAKSNIESDVYRYKDKLPKERIESQRIEDKLDLSAWEGARKAQTDRKFLEIERPESTAKIGEVGARTTLAGARTKKLGEPTPAKASNYNTSIEKTASKIYANADRAKILDAEIEAIRNGGPEVAKKNVLQLAKKIAERKALTDQNIRLQSQQKGIIQKANSGATPSPSTPKRSLGPQFDETTEAALAAAMAKTGMSRPAAIAEAKRRGYIR